MSYLEKLLDGVKVEWKPLGEQLVRTKGTNITAGKMKELHKEGAPIKVFGGGKTVVFIEYDDIPKQHVNCKPSIIVKSRGIIEFEYYDRPFSHKNELWSYHSANPYLHTKFLYHFLKIHQPYFQNLAARMQMPQIATPDTDKFLIPIPCPGDPQKSLEIQQQIVDILDRFTELTAELTARKKQYNYYREKLLSFEEGEVEWKELGEIAEYSKMRITHSVLNERNYVGVDNLLPNRGGKTISKYVPNTGNLISYSKDNILIGNIRPYLKKIWHADQDGGTNGDVLVIQIKDQNVSPKFLYQVLADDAFFEYNMQHSKGAKMPRGDKGKIMEYRVPLPSFEHQQRIVSILDRFDTLTNSLTEGLPKEIELRQKQYEYYRDQLLAFPK